MPIDFTKIPSPSFVLDDSLLIRNLELIQRVAKESDVKIIMALKGFAMYSVFPVINKYVPATTASSINEARLGFEEFGEEVHAYAPAYMEDEIQDWMKYCSHLTFNSFNQYNKYIALMQASTKEVKCGLRINPEYAEVSTDLYNPCVPGSRLGIRSNEFGDKLPKGISGLHFHTLCESNSYSLENTLKVVEEKFGRLLEQCEWVNFGGGHLITQKDYKVEHLIGVLKAFKAKYPHLQVIMEPGAAFAWETGYLVSTVQDYFESDGIQSVLLDVSVAAHMPDCIEMPYTPAILGVEQAKKEEKRTRVGGTSCLAGDYVGDYYFPDGVEMGQKIVFNDMMHYTMVKTTFFNGVKHPNICIWHKDDTLEVVKTFGYEEFKAKLS
jgi:carboxynorspermidine decarboxylase